MFRLLVSMNSTLLRLMGCVLAVVGGSGYSHVYMVDVRSKSVASVIGLPEGGVAKGLFLDGWRLVVVSESSGPFRILDVGGLSFSSYNVNVTVEGLRHNGSYEPVGGW
jgi:hypothetical protein